VIETRAHLWFGLVLAMTALFSACDSGGRRGRPRPKAALQVVEEPDLVLENFQLLGENPNWTPIKDLFKTYESARIEELANAMQSNLVTYVERPIVERKPKADAAPDVAATSTEQKASPMDLDPRRKHPLALYRLIILLTGTAQPKAVVLGPDDDRFELRRGDPLGEEGGRVRAITQYAMMVAVPGKTKLMKVSLRPPLAGVETLFKDNKAANAAF